MDWVYRLRDWCIFYKQEIGLVIIIIFTATLSFALGYLANREFTNVPIVIEQHSSSIPASTP
ncbi:MAG: hypothetical protein FJY98_02830 [Candidatus Liptonbacteria bacterium]|nr:hypothetical protein [Candidatus Liptonbacteria bacterium]